MNTSLEENDHIKQNLKYINSILKTGDSLIVKNNHVGNIFIDKGNIGRSGNGLQHIIEQRFEKNDKSPEEITALLPLVFDSTENGIIKRNTEVYQNEKDIGTYDLEKNGIISFVSKTRDGNEERFVITGFDDYSKKKEAGDAIKAVIANNSYEPEFVIVKQQVVATIASSYILHLKELESNQKIWDSKRIRKEKETIQKYESINNKEIKSEIKKQLELVNQEKLLHGAGSVVINGYTRKFQNGLIEAFPKAVCMLDQAQSENRQLREENQALRNQINSKQDISAEQDHIDI